MSKFSQKKVHSEDLMNCIILQLKIHKFTNIKNVCVINLTIDSDDSLSIIEDKLFL